MSHLTQANKDSMSTNSITPTKAQGIQFFLCCTVLCAYDFKTEFWAFYPPLNQYVMYFCLENNEEGTYE